MADEFEGYRLGDVTYCVDPGTGDFFPVRVVKIGRRFLDVTSLDADEARTIAPGFEDEPMNRRFLRPKLPRAARFGGFDERPVNSRRRSARELRILPCHYWTYTGNAIIERHEDDPTRWPLPTGAVYERWFKRVLDDRSGDRAE